MKANIVNISSYTEVYSLHNHSINDGGMLSIIVGRKPYRDRCIAGQLLRCLRDSRLVIYLK